MNPATVTVAVLNGTSTNGLAGDVSQAFWHACAGGQRHAAEYLLARGADLSWVPDYAEGTPLDAASFLGTARKTSLPGCESKAPPQQRHGTDLTVRIANLPVRRESRRR